MCRGTTANEGYLIKRELIHPSIRHLYTRDIAVDACIGIEVEQLLVFGIATDGMSCCGHDKEQAHVWLFPEYVELAIELGYTIATDHNLHGQPFPSALLKRGTQSSVLKYKGYIHGDENGMFDGNLPPALLHETTLGWSEL